MIKMGKDKAPVTPNLDVNISLKMTLLCSSPTPSKKKSSMFTTGVKEAAAMVMYKAADRLIFNLSEYKDTNRFMIAQMLVQ